MLAARQGTSICRSTSHGRSSLLPPACNSLVTRATLRSSRPRQLTVSARASSRGDSDSFFAGFVLGGVVFGALGFILAPQLSKALLDEPRSRANEDVPKDPEQTQQDLFDKIAQLNSSIDDISDKLGTAGSNSSTPAKAEKLIA